MKYIARPYQKKAVYDIMDYLDKKNKPAIAVLPTGAGKSWIIADLISKLGNPTTLVLQPTQELLKQNYVKYTGPAIKGQASLYSASVGVKEVGHITYATPGSLKNDADKFKHVKFVIIDEAHLGTGSLSMIDKFIQGLGKDVKVIGLTATPIGLKSYSNVAGYFSQLNILTRIRPRFWQDIIHVTQVGELYEQGYLCPLRFTTFNFNMRSAKTKGSDFDLEEVSRIAQEYGVIEYTIKLIKESLKRGKKKILVFTPTVGDAYKIQEEIPELKVVSSKTKKNDRKQIVEDFVEGDLRIIANYGTLTTGFDAPNIDLIICLRPTQSYAIWYQLIGRGIRIAEGKKLCDVIDLSGNYKVFGDPKDLVFEDHPGYGWGMFVKGYLLSGIPIGQKIHKKNLDISEKKITFGKYKGMAFKDIPTSYLEWIRDNLDLTKPWAKKNIVKPLKTLGVI